MGRKKPFRYTKKKISGSLKINQLENFGAYSQKHADFRVINFRLDKELADIKRWKFVEARNGATFFKLPNGVKVVVKPEVWVPFPAMKVGKRDTHHEPRRMLTVLNELTRRKVDIEHPIGELTAKDGRIFYVTKAEKGIHLYDFLMAKPKSAEVEKVAKSMGVFLADMHKKGVLHRHPHDHNWLIHNGKAKLIDSKGVSFREEYPWKTNSGRVHTFEILAGAEAHAASTWLPQSARKTMLASYKRALVKK